MTTETKKYLEWVMIIIIVILAALAIWLISQPSATAKPGQQPTNVTPLRQKQPQQPIGTAPVTAMPVVSSTSAVIGSSTPIGGGVHVQIRE